MAKVSVRPQKSTSSSTPLEALGFSAPGAEPTPSSPVQDLLLYALTLHATQRPDLDIVLVVAAELDALCMFIEGPLHATLNGMSRRLRAAVDLAGRIEAAAEAADAAAAKGREEEP